MKENTKILIILGWRTTSYGSDGLLSEKYGINHSNIPRGLTVYYDTNYNAEYFGIKLMELDNSDMNGANSINYLDVGEKYGCLFDILTANKIHINYQIGRPRIWCIEKK